MEDIISQLPDDILVSIITRISTKDAVRTSILSKNWKNIYKFVSTINVFCYCYCPTRCGMAVCDSEAIIDGLRRVSQLHSGYIRSFEFRCCLTESYAHVFEECIYSLGKGIEKLFLQLSYLWWNRDCFSFPCHLLSLMPSLKYFKLRHCTLQPNLNSHCNSLKTLRLSSVRVLPGSLECILSNCLSLCSLLIKRCELPSKLCFRGPNLQLKCILIYNCEDVEEIELYASNLIIIEVSCKEMVNFIFDYVPQLQSIYLYSLNNTMSYCERLGKDLPHLKSLLLDLLENNCQDSSIPMGIDVFSNLWRLELCIYYAGEIDLFSLIPLLHSCPLLQDFHLATQAGINYGQQLEKRVVFQSQLKKVDISGFSGSQNQIDFILYILKSAVGLQQMYISWYCNVYFGFGEWDVLENPPLCDEWSETMHEYMKEFKHHAVSKTAQVTVQKFPRIKSKQFTEDWILVD